MHGEDNCNHRHVTSLQQLCKTRFWSSQGLPAYNYVFLKKKCYFVKTWLPGQKHFWQKRSILITHWACRVSLKITHVKYYCVLRICKWSRLETGPHVILHSIPRAVLFTCQSDISSVFDQQTKQTNSMVWVRERTIPTERSPLVGEVIANLCG
jgi:hypothetical protein